MPFTTAGSTFGNAWGVLTPNYRFGAIQIWRKILTAQEILALHPNGKRKPFRIATPKDSGVGKIAIITPEDNNFGYSSDSQGNFTNINTINTNLPQIIDSSYYRFTNNVALETPSIAQLPTILATVFRHFEGFNSPTNGVNYLGLYASSFNSSDYVLIASEPSQSRFIIVKKATSGRNLQYHPYPPGFILSDFHEIFVKFPPSRTQDAIVILDGAILPLDSILNLADFGFGNGVFGLGNVFNVPNNLDRGAPDFDSKVLWCNLNADGSLSNLLSQNTYTSQNTIEYQAARLFNQMGFKKSLTTLEPNNPRLLARDYSI